MAQPSQEGTVTPQLREIFDRWVASQNEGDFEAYASLYDLTFTGVKRSGSRTREFDRAGWLADRRRMFRNKMAVKAENIRIDVQSSRAQIVFTQTWAQGSYKDIGKKQLIMILSGNQWLIAGEEMLHSQQLPAAGDVARRLEAVAARVCECRDEACANKLWAEYRQWYEDVRDAPSNIRNLAMKEKQNIYEAAGRVYECLSTTLGGIGDEALPPSPQRCPEWFNRPDKWYCVADCDEACRGEF
jgi:hypothetical protein